MRYVPQTVTTSHYTKLTYRICAGRRFGMTSSLTRHARKCIQKVHPGMDVLTEKVAASQDPSYEAARGLESDAASPVRSSTFKHHILTF